MFVLGVSESSHTCRVHASIAVTEFFFSVRFLACPTTYPPPMLDAVVVDCVLIALSLSLSLSLSHTHTHTHRRTNTARRATEASLTTTKTARIGWQGGGRQGMRTCLLLCRAVGWLLWQGSSSPSSSILASVFWAGCAVRAAPWLVPECSCRWKPKNCVECCKS